jgi:hypothetical protein
MSPPGPTWRCWSCWRRPWSAGGLAFAAGTGWGRPVLVAHGLAGLDVLVLAPWKSVVVRRGWPGAPAPAGGCRWRSGVLVVVAVAAGPAHATGGLAGLGPLSAMQVHVGAAPAAVPGCCSWPSRARPGWPGWRAPGAAFTGSLPVAAVGLADPGRIPVTQWPDDRVQVLDPDAWRLRVTAGGSTRDWTHAELAGFGDRAEAVLDCTGGWYARAAWEGVRLDRLLPPGATDGADTGAAGSLVVASATGAGFPWPTRPGCCWPPAWTAARWPLVTASRPGWSPPAAAASGGSSGWCRSRSTGLPGGASRRSRSPEAGWTVRGWWPRPRPPPAGRPR